MVDPRKLTAEVFAAHVHTVVWGSSNSAEAEERIKAYFSPAPLVWVEERDKYFFDVLIQQFVGIENVSLTCRR